jgi:hypothetical protein
MSANIQNQTHFSHSKIRIDERKVNMSLQAEEYLICLCLERKNEDESSWIRSIYDIV